jgi:hypothetical protein
MSVFFNSLELNAGRLKSNKSPGENCHFTPRWSGRVPPGSQLVNSRNRIRSLFAVALDVLRLLDQHPDLDIA